MKFLGANEEVAITTEDRLEKLYARKAQLADAKKTAMEFHDIIQAMVLRDTIAVINEEISSLEINGVFEKFDESVNLQRELDNLEGIAREKRLFHGSELDQRNNKLDTVNKNKFALFVPVDQARAKVSDELENNSDNKLVTRKF